jgi:hypothetical protein
MTRSITVIPPDFPTHKLNSQLNFFSAYQMPTFAAASIEAVYR